MNYTPDKNPALAFNVNQRATKSKPLTKAQRAHMILARAQVIVNEEFKALPKAK